MIIMYFICTYNSKIHIMITMFILTLFLLIPIGCYMSLVLSFIINAFYDIQEWVVYTYKNRNNNK